MEENKYLCPECGSEMIVTYEKPALNLLCPKCGCKIATTKWEKIDLDKTIYVIRLNEIQSPSMEQIKLVSKLTGYNFIKTKKDLINGNIKFEHRAVELKEKKKIFDNNKIGYSITPEYPY